MTLTALAEQLARNAHKDQVDKQGRPYTVHLEAVSRVAGLLADDVVEVSRVDDINPDRVRAIGWLHDLFEDTDTTDILADTAAYAFKGEYQSLNALMGSLMWLTREAHTPYSSYVRGLAELGSIEAILVKIADNIVNVSTLDSIEDEATRERLAEKYAAAAGTLVEGLTSRAAIVATAAGHPKPELSAEFPAFDVISASIRKANRDAVNGLVRTASVALFQARIRNEADLRCYREGGGTLNLDEVSEYLAEEVLSREGLMVEMMWPKDPDGGCASEPWVKETLGQWTEAREDLIEAGVIVERDGKFFRADGWRDIFIR